VPHGTKQKSNEETKNKKQDAQKKRSSHEWGTGQPDGRTDGHQRRIMPANFGGAGRLGSDVYKYMLLAVGVVSA